MGENEQTASAGSFRGMSDQYQHIDHSTTLQNRLLQLIDTDTTDVTFVVGLGDDSSNSNDTRQCHVAKAMERGRDGHTSITTGRVPELAGSSLDEGLDATVMPGESVAGETSNRRTGTQMIRSNQKCSEIQVDDTHDGNSRERTRPEGQITTERTITGDYNVMQQREPDFAVGSTEQMIPVESSPRVGGGQLVGYAGRQPGNPRDERRNASGAGELREFRCHRVMFAACSEYFRAMLYGGMIEEKTRRVELGGVRPESFEAILKYVYTGRVLVNAGTYVYSISRTKVRSEYPLFLPVPGSRGLTTRAYTVLSVSFYPNRFYPARQFCESTHGLLRACRTVHYISSDTNCRRLPTNPTNDICRRGHSYKRKQDLFSGTFPMRNLNGPFPSTSVVPVRSEKQAYVISRSGTYPCRFKCAEPMFIRAGPA